MRKIVFMRFGPPIQIPSVSAALRPHIANPEAAFAFPMPGGVLSIFDTESTDEQIAADVKPVGVPFFIFPFNPNALNLPEPILERLGATPTTAPEAETELTIDDILQKVHDQGMESLTVVEKAILERGV
jgi:hypothetical protein